MRSSLVSWVRRGRWFVALSSLATLPLVACENIDVQSRTETVVPLYGISDDGAVDPDVIPNQFILVMRDGSTSAMRESLESDILQLGGKIIQRYDSPTFQGLAVILSPSALVDVRKKSVLAAIEADRYGKRTGLQTCPSWNVDMLDHQSPAGVSIDPATMLDRVYTYGDMVKPVHVLVLDTGIGEKILPKSQVVIADGSGTRFFPNDCLTDSIGHGSMVATVVADKTLGVAKGAKLIPFNIDCSDPNAVNKCDPACAVACPAKEPEYSKDIAALGTVETAMATLPKPLVILYPRAFHIDYVDNVLRTKISSIASKGAIFVTGTGEGATDKMGVFTPNVCDFAPAKFAADPQISPRVITVGAITRDGFGGLANSGACMDLFAPGFAIPTRIPVGACGCDAQNHTEPCEIASAWGSSFAAAHAAGVAAMMLGIDRTLDNVKYDMQADARLMNVDGVLPGSPGFVLHQPYNVAHSGMVDVDGYKDWVPDCNGSGCDMCGGVDATNPCNTEPQLPEMCVARMQCTGAECARCGRGGDPCCNDGIACDDGLLCTNGVCACGGPNEPCCETNPNAPCNAPNLGCNANSVCVEECVSTCCDGTQILIGNVEDAVCVRQGGDACWDKQGPQVVSNHGAAIWGPNQCSTLRDTYAACCDGTQISLNQQYDVDVAKEIATAECNKGVPSKMLSLYMDGQIVASVFPDTCGKCEVECCDGTTIGGDYAWPGVSPENACKLFGGHSCKDHGYGPSRIAYDGKILWSKGADQCPTNHPCLATCSDGNTEFVGDTFDEAECDLMAQSKNGCAPAQLVEAHLVKGCGGAGEGCCPDGSCDGEMVCDTSGAAPTCRGRCMARCRKGQLIQYPAELPTDEACVYWAGQTCMKGEPDNAEDTWGQVVRVMYNHVYVYDLDSQFPESCGSDNRYCCMSGDDIDDDGETDRCQTSGARCISFDPAPNQSIGRQVCSTCGGFDQRCCDSTLPECGIGRTCTHDNVKNAWFCK